MFVNINYLVIELMIDVVNNYLVIELNYCDVIVNAANIVILLRYSDMSLRYC
jgi:hypothetical protein